MLQHCGGLSASPPATARAITCPGARYEERRRLAGMRAGPPTARSRHPRPDGQGAPAGTDRGADQPRGALLVGSSDSGVVRGTSRPRHSPTTLRHALAFTRLTLKNARLVIWVKCEALGFRTRITCCAAPTRFSSPWQIFNLRLSRHVHAFVRRSYTSHNTSLLNRGADRHPRVGTAI